MALKRCSKLRDTLGSNTIENNKVKRHTLYAVNMSLPKRSRATPQIHHTTFTMSLHAKVNMLSTLWNVLNVRSKYVGKSEWPFNIRFNNHRKDLKRIDAIPAIRHQTGHNFEHDAKFTIIEHIRNLNKEKQKKRKILEHREDFSILKLKTLQPY